MPAVVLTRKVGHERTFALELLLYVVTFGLYGIYWHYQVHHEVYRQYELDQEGRSEGTLWLLYSRVFFPLIWAYQYAFAANLHHVRHRLGFERGLTGGRILGLTIPGSVAFWGGGILLILAADSALVAGLSDAEQQDLGITDAEQAAARTTATVLAIIAAVLVPAGAVLLIAAYAMLQRQVNETWRAYLQRMHELTSPAWPEVQEDPAPPWPATG